jgi:hypothetical protein
MSDLNSNDPDGIHPVPALPERDVLSGETHAGQSMAEDRWRILIIEAVHLLGLLIIHARHARSARATNVLFDQFVRHLNILGSMPEHDGAVLIRKVTVGDRGASATPNYQILFGDLMLRGDSALEVGRSGQGRAAQLGGALHQAFGCFAEHGIQTLYLRLPDRSDSQIDRMRLALNIAARFRQASDNHTSITFRYYGRTVTVPLIRDRHGAADPNLTLLAGLNGLTGANMRELIKQAQAYCNLESIGKEAPHETNWFDLILNVRSLRTHIVRPPLEINNTPWSLPRTAKVAGYPLEPGGGTVGKASNRADQFETDAPGRPMQFGAQFLIDRLGSPDGEILQAIEALFAEDYSSLTPTQLGPRLLLISRLLYVLEDKVSDSSVAERVLSHLSACLDWIPESVRLCITMQRKGMRIGSGRNALLIGMVHPRLSDLITMVKERVLTRRKIEAVQAFVFGFKEPEAANLAERFEIGLPDVRAITALLEACFDSQGRFGYPAFEARIDQMASYESIIFEILWCLFKRTADRKERLGLLQAIRQLIARLEKPKRAVRFLLSDICQNPFEVKHLDRNAFVLANILACADNRHANSELNRTSAGVLAIPKGTHRRIQKYAAWRLDFDQVCMLTKIRTIGDMLQRTAEARDSEKPLLFDYDFLIALEREIFIFLALVGGQTARIILRHALARYGRFEREDPDSRHPLHSLPAVQSQLLIIIRGLGCIGTERDLDLLREFERKIMDMQTSKTNYFHHNADRRILEALTLSIKAIQHE